MNSVKNAPLVPITELLEDIIDNRGKSCPTQNTGFPLIATNCIKHSSIYPTFENIRYVSDDVLRTWFRAELKPKDILFVNKGTPGRVCLVPDPITFCAAQDMIGLRANPNKVYYKYLFAILRSNYIQEKIKNFHVGIAIPHFKKSDMDNLLIPVPEMSLQIKIGDIYCQLSERIENNNKINLELEAMAKTIYDYWFLQFEFPNEDGKPYKSSGGRMVWSEELKRKIPEGWEIDTIGKHINIDRGISYSSDDLGDVGIPLINLSSFNIDATYKPEGLKTYSGTYSKEKVISPFDLVICVTQQTAIDLVGDTDVIGKTFLVPDIFETKDIVASMDVIKIQSDDTYGKYYLNRLINTKFFHRYISGFATGTKIKHLDIKGLLNYKCETPNEQALKKFNDLMESCEKKKSKIVAENQELTALRDFLLPLLMNGQVGFKD